MFRLSPSIIISLVSCLFFAMGCEDSGQTGIGAGPAVPVPTGMNSVDSGPIQSTDMGAIANNNDAGVDVARECEPGERRCEIDGGTTEQQCGADGLWRSRGCQTGEVCQNGGCLRLADDCEPGSTLCLPNGNVGVCDNDEWVDQGTCDLGLTCFQGACQSEACVATLRNQSYIGCDFLSLELPNTAHDRRDEDGDGVPDSGTTENSPTGLIVANSSTTVSTYITLKSPTGNVSSVISQRTIDFPGKLPASQIGSVCTLGARNRCIDDVRVASCDGIVFLGQWSETDSCPSNSPCFMGECVPGLPFEETSISSNVKDAMGGIVQDNISEVSSLEIPPGGVATLLLPRGELVWASSVVRRSAYRLTSTQPVVAYQFSPYCCNYSFSNDASLLFPTSTLGSEYRYIGAAHHSTLNLNNLSQIESPMAMVVVAAEDGTQVVVDIPPGQEIVEPIGGQIVVEGQQVRIGLDAQDVAILPSVTRTGEDPVDLSGAKVTADKPFALFSNHICTFAPSDKFACDHLQEQIYPLATWGSQYQLVPLALRGTSDREVIYWKLVADVDGTQVSFSTPFQNLNSIGSSADSVPQCAQFLGSDGSLLLNAGDYCEMGLRGAVQIQASQPVIVSGMTVGQAAVLPVGSGGLGQRAGDPSLFLMPADQQFRSDYVFLTPETYFVDYVTLITPADNSIMHNGGPLNLDGAQAIEGSSFVYKHIELPVDGPQSLIGSRPFGIIVYAYDDFVSYAFTGGINLTKF